MLRDRIGSVAVSGAVALFVLACVACDKKGEGVGVAPSASALSPSVAAPSAKVVKVTIDPKGKTSIDMEAPKEHIKAATEVAGGTVEVDLMNLANTRGEVKVDLSSLKTSTFNDSSKDAAQTGHALTWLEVADGADGKLPEEVKTQNRFAVFAIRSIDSLSATDVSKIAPTKSANGDDVRVVTATAHGDFLLHGHKVDKAIPLEITFRHPAGAPAGSNPTQIDISTKSPFRVTLAEHDVKPRDSFGKIAKGAFNLLGTKVAETATITMEMHGRL